MSDEERDLRKYSRRSAIGLMGVGGGLAATETLGFTNVTAGRGVNVDVVDDLDGLIGIEVTSEGGSETLDESTTFSTEIEVEFTNQGETDLELTVEVTDIDTDVTVNQNIDGSSNDSATVEDIGTNDTPGNTLKVENNSEDQERDFSVSISGTFDDGASVDLDRENITLDSQS